MRTQRTILGLLAAVVLLASCGKKGPAYTRYIPKDAAYVVAIDVQSMMTKLQSDSLTVENMLDVVKDEKNPATYATALEYWKQFQDAGLDFDNKMLLAFPKLNIEKGEITAEVVAGLKDDKKLEAFVAKLPNSPKITKEGKISMVTTPDFALGWNKEAVVILATGGGAASTLDVLGDSTSPQIGPAPGSSNPTELLKKYFDLKEDESMASVDAFVELLTQQADLAMFSNDASLSSAAGMNTSAVFAMMPKAKELMEGVYSTTVVNFESGKMVMESQTFAGKKLADLLSKYAGPTVDMSLLEAYPSQEINALVGFSFKPELLPAFLKELGLDALVNMGLAEAGSNVDEVAKAFKGDFAVMVSDFAVVQMDMGKDALYQRNEPKAKMVVAARIGDQAAFDKLVGFGEKSGMIRREGNRLIPMDAGETTGDMGVIGIENGVLVYSNDSAVYQAYVSKKAKLNIPAEAKTALDKKSVGFYINVGSILQGVPESMFDSTDTHEHNILLRSREVFKGMAFSAGNFDGKKLTGSGELTMGGAKNSLPQLVRFLMYVAAEMKAKDQERESIEAVELEVDPVN